MIAIMAVSDGISPAVMQGGSVLSLIELFRSDLREFFSVLSEPK